MSQLSSIRSAVLLFWAHRFVVAFSGLLVTPILFRSMSFEELGIWFLISQSQPLLSLMGLGIGPVLTRHIAMGVAEARAKAEAGNDPNGRTPTSDAVKVDFDLPVVYGTGQILLKIIAVLTLLFGLVLSIIILNNRTFETVSFEVVITSWLLFLGGYSMGVWLSHLESLLAGSGQVGQNALVLLIVAVLQAVSNATVALAGGGLLGLSIVQLMILIIQRVLLVRSIRKLGIQELTIGSRFESVYAKRLVNKAALNWLNIVGVFVVMQSWMWFVSIWASVVEIPLFQAANSLTILPYQLGVSFISASSVYISQAWHTGNVDRARKLTLDSTRLAITLVAVGHGITLACGESFFLLWLGPDRFPGYALLLILMAVWTLESMQYSMSFAGRSTDDESYTWPVLTAAFLAPGLMYLLNSLIGLIGIPLGALIAQTLTVNAYAVYRTMSRMQIPWIRFIRGVVAPWALVLATTTGLGFLASSQISEGTWSTPRIQHATSVLACAGIGGIVFCICHIGMVSQFGRSFRRKLLRAE